MKSAETTLWTLKRHLCSLTLKGTLCEEQRLLSIQRVQHSRTTSHTDLQDLGCLPAPIRVYEETPRKITLSALMNISRSRTEEVKPVETQETGAASSTTTGTQPPKVRSVSGLIRHLPKAKKRTRPEDDIAKPLQATLTLKSADPNVHCIVCHWRYPCEYSEEDKKRHRDMAKMNTCHKDTENHTEEVKAAKHAKRMKERDKLMNGSAESSDVTACPHCSKSLEGKYGPYKQAHISDCAARCIDKELNKIVCESALIPKKKKEKPDGPDPFAISFKSLQRRNRPLGPELA